MSYLTVFGRDGKLLLASLRPDGMQVRETEVPGEGSPDGKYLAVRDHFYDPATIRILKLPFDAAPPRGTTPGVSHE